jgi:hypothetical protein
MASLAKRSGQLWIVPSTNDVVFLGEDRASTLKAKTAICPARKPPGGGEWGSVDHDEDSDKA